MIKLKALAERTLGELAQGDGGAVWAKQAKTVAVEQAWTRTLYVLVQVQRGTAQRLGEHGPTFGAVSGVLRWIPGAGGRVT